MRSPAGDDPTNAGPLSNGCAVNLNPRLMLWVGLHGVTSVLSIDGEPSVAASTRGEVMSKQSKETGDMFRPSKKPMTEYEAEQLEQIPVIPSCIRRERRSLRSGQV
jgi:hypothetical protein